MMALYSLLLAHLSTSRARSTGTGCVISLLREFATHHPELCGNDERSVSRRARARAHTHARTHSGRRARARRAGSLTERARGGIPIEEARLVEEGVDVEALRDRLGPARHLHHGRNHHLVSGSGGARAESIRAIISRRP